MDVLAGRADLELLYIRGSDKAGRGMTVGDRLEPERCKRVGAREFFGRDIFLHHPAALEVFQNPGTGNNGGSLQVAVVITKHLADDSRLVASRYVFENISHLSTPKTIKKSPTPSD